MARHRIGIVGASGTIGRLLTRALAHEHDLILFDRHPLPTGQDATHFTMLNLADRAALHGCFDGVDILLHLAADAHPLAAWDSVLENNIIATQHLFDEAVAAGVRKVVFASSCHTQHGTSRGSDISALDPAFAASDQRHRTTDPPAADSLYGISKLFGENLGRYHAVSHGLQFVGLRLGWIFVDDDPTAQRGEVSESYARAIFMSHRDCVELFRCAIAFDGPFVLGYGISDNTDSIYDLEETKRCLGYRPRDCAAARFEEA